MMRPSISVDMDSFRQGASHLYIERPLYLRASDRFWPKLLHKRRRFTSAQVQTRRADKDPNRHSGYIP